MGNLRPQGLKSTPSASQESWPPSGSAASPRPRSLELVLPGTADLGGEALGQLLQAAGVLELDLGFAAEELLEVLEQLQPRLRLLLQALELLHQLRADLCGQEARRAALGGAAPATRPAVPAAPLPHRPPPTRTPACRPRHEDLARAASGHVV